MNTPGAPERRTCSLLHRRCPYPRAKVLAILGVLGIARALTVISDAACINPQDAVLHELVPVPVRIVFWIASGAAVLVCALRPRWHPTGFFIAALMPLERAFGYLWSVVAWIVPGDPRGSLGSVAWLIWWGFITLLIRHIARWPEPPTEVP